MRLLRVLLALGLVVCFVRGGEILTESEETIKDVEVVSVGAKEVVYKVNGKEVTRKIGEVRKIDLRDVGKINAEKFSQVDLTDGTTLLASEWAIKLEAKGKDEKVNTLQMKLLSGPTVKLPMETVNGILNNAKDDKDRTDWKNRVINTRGRDAIVIKRVVTRKDKKSGKEEPVLDDSGKPQTVTFNLPATIGSADEKGETIKAAVILDEKKDPVEQAFKQKDMHGIIFKNTLPPKAPAPICKVVDTLGNAVMVSKLEDNKDGVTVTTPSGAKMDFTFAQLSQIDYTRGRLDYLSALTPDKTTITLNQFDAKDKLPTDYKWFVYKDSSLNMTPIKLGGTSYRHGLTLLPDVDLEYSLNGNYRQFDAVIGIDDETKAEGDVTLEIYGDGKKLESLAIASRTTKDDKGQPVPPARKPTKVSLNVKDVATLKIVLKAKDELSGLSISVSLAEARVSR